MLIESSNNPKIKKWTKLKQKKYRYQVNEYIVEGEHLVIYNHLNNNNLCNKLLFLCLIQLLLKTLFISFPFLLMCVITF